MADIIKFVNRAAAGEFLETPTAGKIMRLIDFCQSNGDLGLIVGAPGIGKTTALRYYAHTRPGIRYIVMNPSSGSVTAALTMVCAAFDALPERTRAELHEIICHRLRLLDGRDDPILLIDEAQHLNDQALDQLRCIHDETKLAMVFAGNATLKSRFNNTRVAAFAQFTSRVGMRLMLDRPTQEDVAVLCRTWGVAGAREAAFLEHHAMGAGGLRIVAKIINAAVCGLKGPESIRLDHLQSAADMLGV